jgi:GNAT superfamily N-acetyltransferase
MNTNENPSEVAARRRFRQPPMTDQNNGGLRADAIAIRSPMSADRGEWERLFRAYIDFYERTLDDVEYDRAWQRLLKGREIRGLVATVDGVTVGIVHFLTHAHTNASDVCYLQDLFTDPAARGSGVGTALIEAVARWAREQGCGRVYWHTQADNERARRLYDQVAEHRGFVVYQLAL